MEGLNLSSGVADAATRYDVGGDIDVRRDSDKLRVRLVVSV
jgi:hypothetical protein